MNKSEEVVVFKVFDDPLEARVLQNKLLDAGIECILVDENVIGLNPLGGVAVKIFATDMEKAKEVFNAG